MEPMTYGSMIASHLEELRAEAARERAARRGLGTRAVAGWRLASGRFLMTAGGRLAGCAELARSEANPVVKVLG